MIDRRFYDLLKYLGQGGTYQYFWTPDTDEGKLSIWFPTAKPKEVSHLWTTINVYFGVHPSRTQGTIRTRAKLEDIEAINCLFAEFDLADNQSKEHLFESIMSLETPPSVVVFSGGGYHCYWLLKQTYYVDSEAARQRITEIQYAWADFVGSDGAAKDLSRVLRVPGSFNRKPERGPNFPQIEIVRFELDATYELDELSKQVESIIKYTKEKHIAAANMDVVAVEYDDQTILEKMWSKDPDTVALWAGDLSAYHDDHSSADLALCSKLAFWFGRDPVRIDRVFRRSALYRDKWLRQDYRTKTIDKAIASCQNTYTVYVNGSSPGNPEALVTSRIHTNGNPAQHAKLATMTNTPSSIDDLLVQYTPDDWGNAQSVFLLYGQEFGYCETHGYLHYNGKFWETEGAEAHLTKAIVDTLIRRRIVAVRKQNEAIVKVTRPDASKVQATIFMFKSLIGIDINEFDSSPDLLNCQNGAVDLRTGVLHPHNAGQKFTYCIPVDYDASADYANWTNFLSSTVVSPEVIAYMKLALGYSATGHTSEECLFYVHGPTRSGKGTFAETILTLLCKPLGVQADFSTFTAKREGDTQNFDLAPLKPARFIVASESDKYDTLNEAKVKTITGGDWIRCAFKHRNHFEYRPQFKVWLLSNHPIKGDVDDDAFWGRARLVDFPNSHLGNEDKNLKHRMKSPANLRGVLRWIVEGAMEWYKNPQGLQTPPQVDQANKQRRLELDFVQQWLDACCKIDQAAWTQNAAVYYSYKSWCEGTGIRPKSMESLSQILIKKGFRTGIQKRIANGQRARGIEGFSIT